MLSMVAFLIGGMVLMMICSCKKLAEQQEQTASGMQRSAFSAQRSPFGIRRPEFGVTGSPVTDRL
jgi:hypothetical protein